MDCLAFLSAVWREIPLRMRLQLVPLSPPSSKKSRNWLALNPKCLNLGSNPTNSIPNGTTSSTKRQSIELGRLTFGHVEVNQGSHCSDIVAVL